MSLVTQKSARNTTNTENNGAMRMLSTMLEVEERISILMAVRRLKALTLVLLAIWGADGSVLFLSNCSAETAANILDKTLVGLVAHGDIQER